MDKGEMDEGINGENIGLANSLPFPFYPFLFILFFSS
jgi:hypothetical protein